MEARASKALVTSLLATGILLAGCGDGTGGTGGDGGTPEAYAMDGQAAHAFVASLLQHSRVPGTPGHAATQAALQEAMEVPGWTVTTQSFTGAAFLEVGHGAAQSYIDHPAFCSDASRERLGNLTFTNLVATWDRPGSANLSLEAPRWWLGAHWDAKRFASQDTLENRTQEVPGANDGASGVGVLLQLMRDVADEAVRPVADLGVLLVDGEDGFEDCHPLAGSTWFVAHRGPWDVDRFLLLDMVGDKDARFAREVHAETCASAWADLVWSRAASHGLGANFVSMTRSVSDDHVPFVEAGIPALDLIDVGREPEAGRGGFPPYWHTTQDTLDKVDAGMLGRVGSLVGDILDEDVEIGCG